MVLRGGISLPPFSQKRAIAIEKIAYAYSEFEKALNSGRIQIWFRTFSEIGPIHFHGVGLGVDALHPSNSLVAFPGAGISAGLSETEIPTCS